MFKIGDHTNRFSKSFSLFPEFVSGLGVTLLGLSLVVLQPSLVGDELEEAPGQVAEATPQPLMKGIVILSACDKMLPPEKAKDVTGVEVVDVALPDGTYRLQDRLYKKVDNAPFCKEWLEEVKKEIEQYYQDCNRPFMVVEIPEQDITKGVIQIVVKEGRIGKISCTGNEYYPSEYFADFLGLREGQQIVYDVLAESVAWLGMRPFSQVELVFKPGENEGEVDIEIIAHDRKPWKVFAGADNTGTKATSYGRVFTGVVIDDVFKSGGVLNFEYKGSDDFNRLRSYFGGYTVPIRCGHILSFYGGHAEVEPHIRDFHSSGNFSQASFFYSIPLQWRVCRWVNNIGVGLNWKRTNSNLFFIDNPDEAIVDGTVNLSQLLLSYNWGHHYRRHSMTFSSQLIVSPGSILPDESNHDYNELQHKAKSTYAYMRLGGDCFFYLPHEMTFALKGAGQVATGTLLPSEQFSLGGVGSVRGYDPGEYLADNGASLILEFYTPPINFKLGNTKRINSYLLFLAFVDSGIGNQFHALGGTRKTDYLVGVGPGARYKIDNYLEAELDWGIKLHKVKGGTGLDQRFYFTVTASY